MFISQNAVGLAWLRAFAMTIIVHKLLMENERKVATNNNMAIVHNMDTWPRGRVLVYGLDIPEGQLLLQQPVFVSRIVDVPAMPELPLFRQSETEETRRNTLRNTDETPLEADGEMKVTPLFRVSEEEQPARLKKEMVSDETKRTIAKMAKDGIPHRKIAGYVHLSGEKYGLFKQVCTELGIETKKAEEA